MPIGRPLCRVGVRWVSVDTLSRSKNTSVGRAGEVHTAQGAPVLPGKASPGGHPIRSRVGRGEGPVHAGTLNGPSPGRVQFPRSC